MVHDMDLHDFFSQKTWYNIWNTFKSTQHTEYAQEKSFAIIGIGKSVVTS